MILHRDWTISPRELLKDVHVLKVALALLDTPARRKLVLLVAVQISLSLLDFVSVGLVGLIGALAISAIQSTPTAGVVAQVTHLIGIDVLSVQAQVAVLGLLAVLSYAIRTWAGIKIIRRSLQFLALRSAEVASTLFSRALRLERTHLAAEGDQHLLYVVTTGSNALLLGLVGGTVAIVSDISMLISISVILVLASPLTTLVVLVMALVLFLSLHRFTAGRAANLGRQSSQIEISSRSHVQEALATIREIRVRNSFDTYSTRFASLRRDSSGIAADIMFLPNVSKYVMESAVVVGALILAGATFATTDARSAISVLALFLAAGSRLAPGLIRVQQGLISVKGSVGAAQPVLNFLDSAEPNKPLPQTEGSRHFSASVDVSRLSFHYPNAPRTAIDDISFRIDSGMLALVGPSGSGKSTLVDLLLGVLTPDSGEVRVSGVQPNDATTRWPGFIGYVPQETWISNGSIRHNVLLGLNQNDYSDEQVWQALRLAQLGNFVDSLPDKLNQQVGERGARLSGGQRQRLGIARALVTSPKLLILDEATSALDATTEYAITGAIAKLRTRMTLIVVAHRLSTIRDADRILYMESGRLVSIGTFAEVQLQVPAFAAQASLLGLD